MAISPFAIPLAGQGEDSKRPMTRAQVLQDGEKVGRRTEDRQIVVYSGYPMIKTRFDVYSRNIRTQFRHMIGLHDSDDWHVNIRIHLWGTGNDVYSGTETLASGSLEPSKEFVLRLDVKLHDRFKEETFRLALIRLLLIEQMLGRFRDNPDQFQDLKLRPPDWLVHGFDRNLKHKELGKPSYFYAGFLKSGQLMRVKEITQPTQAQGLNPISLELFRASSAVLVGALCEQRGGGESMRGLLGDFAIDPDADAMVLIRKHFPAFRETGQGIDKWWALQLATLAQQQSFEYFDPEETDQFLNQALEIFIPAEEVKPLAASKPAKAPSFFDKIKEKTIGAKGKNDDDPKPAYRGSVETYREFIGRKEANQLLAHRESTLLSLKVRAFPLFHDVIDQYAEICRKLRAKKFDGVDKELAKLTAMRKQILKSVEHSNDYLNYYEATRSPKRSEAFDSYLKFKDEMKSLSSPQRSDEISKFLDKVERQLPFR